MKKAIAVLLVLVVYAGFAFAGEKARDGRFIAYDNGTVLDTNTNLMWAARDNGSNINWQNAKSYCENYRGGGYTDWRMPTQDELAGLYDQAKTYKSDCGWDVNLTDLIHLTCTWAWASETRGSDAAHFVFDEGGRYWRRQFRDVSGRALPVRSGNQNAPSSEVPLFKAETQGSPMSGTGGVAGTWNSNWGPVSLTHEPIVNNQPVYVTGSWNQGDGKIGQLTNGTFDPVSGVLKFSYYQPWNGAHGIQKFKLSNDGRKMEGHPDNEGGFDWVCTSSLQQGEHPSVSTNQSGSDNSSNSIAGTWTSDTFGDMTINQSGSDIIVSYTWQNGRIIGKLVGNVLAGNWIQGSSDQRCSYAKENSFYWGKLNITFSGNSYSGTWGYCDTEPKTDWKGKRK